MLNSNIRLINILLLEVIKIYRIKQTIQALTRIVMNPKNLFYVLNNEEYFQEKVRKEYGIKESGCKTIQFDDLNIPFPETITTYSFLGGTSSITDLILLKGLALQIRTMTIVLLSF